MTSLLLEGTKKCFDPGEPWMVEMMSRKGLIRDFKFQYIVKYVENEAPYDREIKEYTNEIVEKWSQISLEPNCDEFKKMTAQEATDRWYSYFETLETRLATENWDLCMHPLEKETEKWIDIFNTKLPSEIFEEYGEKTVKDAYVMVTCAWDDWFVQKKFKTCFQPENDPNECLRKFKKHKLLFTQEKCPFDLNIIRAKMATILNGELEPEVEPEKEGEEKEYSREGLEGIIKVKISENDKPYDKAMKEYYQKLLRECYDICIKEKKIPLKKALADYSVYIDVRRVKLAAKHWDKTYHPSDELVQKWKEIFGTLSPGKIVRFGLRTVRDGYMLLNMALEDWLLKKKYEECCVSEDLNECCEKLRRFKVEVSDLPIDIDQVAEKMEAIVKPENKPGPKRDIAGAGRKIF